MTTLQIPTARVFTPLLEPARYKGAWGGRGSGKSRFFAGLLCEDAARWPGDAGEGLRAICGREVQKSLKDSAKHLLEVTLKEFRLGEKDGFRIYADRIQTPGDGLIIFQGLQDHTADTIKSFEGFHRFWGEESHAISARSLGLVRPTIRWEDAQRGLASELWFSWNPRLKVDPVDIMLRQDELPTDAVVVRANWQDNPWFPAVLEQERLDCLRTDPDQYSHIWDGDYVKVIKGAYYAQSLSQARQEGRIGRVAADPLLPIRIFCDLGGTGAKSDAFAMWAAQFVGREIRVLNHYEAVGQPLGTHIGWLREQKYTDDRAQIWLPHDGETNDRVHDVSFESAFISAGYEVTVVPNQGKGAAKSRIEALRRLFPSIWFNESTCEGGLAALGWYHEKIDEHRNIGLGPDHDWASHSSDAAGLMAVAYKPPTTTARKIQTTPKRRSGGGASWMGS